MKTQDSSDFNEDLYALSMRADINVHTYTACIVNGVRFMVLDRDSQRTTQNFGVVTEDENNVKYYGQLEEIIEVHYAYKCSTVLFRCKWFDPAGYSFDNDITTINTEREWNKDDQLIFASQAKQVFYIREPSRGNKTSRWVVENVNHRKIWDLPLNDGPVDDVHNDSIDNVHDDIIENVDVVHDSTSSNFNFVIDFSQYFQNVTNHDTDEADVETNPPTVAEGNVSDAETDYDEDDPDYDTEEYDQDTEVYDGESD